MFMLAWKEKLEMPTTSRLSQVFVDDQYLVPYEGFISGRNQRFNDMKSRIETSEGSLVDFSRGDAIFGLRKRGGEWVVREYLPGACAVHLIGDFNAWDTSATPLTREDFGRWVVKLPSEVIQHGQKYKLAVTCADGSVVHRVSAWAEYAIQNPSTNLFDGVVWDPSGGKYQMKHSPPAVVQMKSSVRIYEAHIGMSSSAPEVTTYAYFRQHVLPRIRRLGYNVIQLMAIPEHAYYGSFGYHVTSFFAPSSRFGTPDDLRELVDAAHGLGIAVLMDIVHAHMSSNSLDGIAMIDGTDHCYSHSGPQGRHELWDSALFDYSKWETLRFLLSNCRYWVEEFGFDGFRFDGITSMLYKHHGIGVGFSGAYQEYFGDTVDLDASIYLMLANELVNTIRGDPGIVTIAEDVSGMPLLCRPVDQGGLGFDYRLAMAIPDMWIRLLKDQKDEEWNMGHIVHTLTNRRWNEKTVAYAESHDQAIVGDKTIAMWLLDAEIYTKMDINSKSHVIDRGIALHKLIRLLTCALGNNGYLNFMGNEFGHPEWVDFPREGNGWSYHWCRRRWDLADDPHLRFAGLERFDAAMMRLVTKCGVLDDCMGEYVLEKDEDRKVIAFERAGLLFIFNFHPNNALVDHPVFTRLNSPLRVVMDSDQPAFGGIGHRISHQVDMLVVQGQVKVYLPPRCCMVLCESVRDLVLE
jgi:1,4-alpha-glucan branching enzyme